MKLELNTDLSSKTILLKKNHLRQNILLKKNNLLFVNESLTSQSLSRAFYILSEIISRQGHLLIVNTNPEQSKLCHILLEDQISSSSQISTCFTKWIGGTLTNYQQVAKSIHSFLKFSEFCESAGYHDSEYLVKKNQKLNNTFSGYIRHNNNNNNNNNDMTKKLKLIKKPDLLFCFNPQDNIHLILEAKKLSIPIIALVDPNIQYNFNLQDIEYPIPCNTSSIEFLFFLLKKLNYYFKTQLKHS